MLNKLKKLLSHITDFAKPFCHIDDDNLFRKIFDEVSKQYEFQYFFNYYLIFPKNIVIKRLHLYDLITFTLCALDSAQ